MSEINQPITKEDLMEGFEKFNVGFLVPMETRINKKINELDDKIDDISDKLDKTKHELMSEIRKSREYTDRKSRELRSEVKLAS